MCTEGIILNLKGEFNKEKCLQIGIGVLCSVYMYTKLQDPGLEGCVQNHPVCSGVYIWSLDSEYQQIFLIGFLCACMCSNFQALFAVKAQKTYQRFFGL